MSLPQRLCLGSALLVVVIYGGDLDAAAPATLGAVSDVRVGFRASGPAGMTIEGTTPDLRVGGDDTTTVLTVPLANLTTGIALRDEHMRTKYLEVPKYPNATLRVARADLRFPEGGNRAEADAPGTLELHGKTNPVTLHYDAALDGGAVVVHGRFHVKMTDFDISVPSYLGVTVKPDVDVSAAFKVARSGP